jgi:hypothetical protein
MTQATLPTAAQNDKAANSACNKLNAEIEAIRNELAAIGSEAAAVTSEALEGSEVDASALIKRIEKVKVRKLAVAIREKRLTGLESDFNSAVRAAAKTEALRLQQAIDRREGELNKCADGLGYGPTAIQRTQLVRTDVDRGRLVGLLKDASSASYNFRFAVNEPQRTAELNAIIADSLKL